MRDEAGNGGRRRLNARRGRKWRVPAAEREREAMAGGGSRTERREWRVIWFAIGGGRVFCDVGVLRRSGDQFGRQVYVLGSPSSNQIGTEHKKARITSHQAIGSINLHVGSARRYTLVDSGRKNGLDFVTIRIRLLIRKDP
nr:hypothetical protein Iba_chr04aCG17950 [Ipomoea batatas]